jgi:hypothetical protein
LEGGAAAGQVAVTIQPARPGDLLPILLESMKASSAHSPVAATSG